MYRRIQANQTQDFREKIQVLIGVRESPWSFFVSLKNF